MGYVDQALVLDKASEYHACQGPRWSECAISCGAGGTLNDIWSRSLATLTSHAEVLGLEEVAHRLDGQQVQATHSTENF